MTAPEELVDSVAKMQREMQEENEKLPAEPDEEMKTILQIEEIQKRTIRPGLMRLPVRRVVSSSDASTVRIDVDHPTEDEIRFSLTKPTTWDPNNELVEFLDWYGLTMSGIYQLQTHAVYVEKDGGWKLAKPPGEQSRIERLRDRVEVPDLDLNEGIALTVGVILVGVWIAANAFLFSVGLTDYAAGEGGLAGITGGMIVANIGTIVGLAFALGMLVDAVEE